MESVKSRKSDIESRLATLVDLKSLPSDGRLARQRRRSSGLAMIALSVLILVAGLYLPAGDGVWQAIFFLAALLYAGLGARSIDRANSRKE